MTDYEYSYRDENMPILSLKWPHMYLGAEPYEFPVGEGWQNICAEAFGKIADIYSKNIIPLEQFEVIQIKEKFAGLRIYTGGLPLEIYDAVEDVIVEAEDKSYNTCEICGKPGVVRYGGWWRTLCDKHAKEAGYKVKEEPEDWLNKDDGYHG